MSRPNIILTGFMGSGKTTVGKLLARELKYDFVDTDHLIEKRCGISIQQIFQTQGEATFRDMEAKIARELGILEKMVIATGGGLVLNPGNLAALTGNGRVFCLTATAEEILQRVATDSNVIRPLLETPDPLERIVELIGEREEGYGKFTKIITSNKSPQEVVQTLMALFQAEALTE